MKKYNQRQHSHHIQLLELHYTLCRQSQIKQTHMHTQREREGTWGKLGDRRRWQRRWRRRRTIQDPWRTSQARRDRWRPPAGTCARQSAPGTLPLRCQYPHCPFPLLSLSLWIWEVPNLYTVGLDPKWIGGRERERSKNMNLRIYVISVFFMLFNRKRMRDVLELNGE